MVASHPTPAALHQYTRFGMQLARSWKVWQIRPSLLALAHWLIVTPLLFMTWLCSYVTMLFCLAGGHAIAGLHSTELQRSARMRTPECARAAPCALPLEQAADRCSSFLSLTLAEWL